MGTYEIKVKSINLPDGGSWTGPVKIYPPSVGSGNQKNINPAKVIKLSPKRPVGAKGGYFSKKVRKPQKK